MTNQIPFIDAQIDQSWQLQGRIIPPSCTKGDGCILHLQTKQSSWADHHFHVARVNISADTAVEFVMSQLMPISFDLTRISLDTEEAENSIDYLAMARLSKPEDAIAFPTVTGLTVVIHNKELTVIFGQSERCKDCMAQETSGMVYVPSLDTNGFDSLMKMDGERSH